jgi:hypothetical protein
MSEALLGKLGDYIQRVESGRRQYMRRFLEGVVREMEEARYIMTMTETWEEGEGLFDYLAHEKWENEGFMKMYLPRKKSSWSTKS